MKRGTACAVHVHKALVPQADHHILPQEYGGPTTKANLARLCYNGHADVHYFLDLFLKYDGDIPWELSQHFYVTVRNLAERGYEEIKKNPKLHEVAQTLAIARLHEDVEMLEFGKRKLRELNL